DLGRTYMRPMGLEADRRGFPPPPDHPFYLICARQGGLVSRVVGEGDNPDDPRVLAWKPLRALLQNEEAAYWDRGVALPLPAPGPTGSSCGPRSTPPSAATGTAPSSSNVGRPASRSSRSSTRWVRGATRRPASPWTTCACRPTTCSAASPSTNRGAGSRAPWP